MPIKIAEMINQKPESQLENFEYIKEMLLNRFKLSSEAFRTKFVSHSQQRGSVWKDLVFEVRNCLEGWFSGFEVKTFEFELRSGLLPTASKPSNRLKI